MKRDDVTDPEGLDLKLVEVEREEKSNGHVYPADPEALAALTKRLQSVQEKQATEQLRQTYTLAHVQQDLAAIKKVVDKLSPVSRLYSFGIALGAAVLGSALVAVIFSLEMHDLVAKIAAGR